MTVERLKAAIRADKGRHEIVEHDGLKFEVREPTVGDMARYADSIGADGEKTSATAIQTGMMRLLTKCVYDPESGAPVFGENDIEDMLASRGLVMQFSKVVMGYVNSTKAVVGKESEGTGTSANGSS